MWGIQIVCPGARDARLKAGAPVALRSFVHSLSRFITEWNTGLLFFGRTVQSTAAAIRLAIRFTFNPVVSGFNYLQCHNSPLRNSGTIWPRYSDRCQSLNTMCAGSDGLDELDGEFSTLQDRRQVARNVIFKTSLRFQSRIRGPQVPVPRPTITVISFTS